MPERTAEIWTRVWVNRDGVAGKSGYAEKHLKVTFPQTHRLHYDYSQHILTVRTSAGDVAAVWAHVHRVSTPDVGEEEIAG